MNRRFTHAATRGCLSAGLALCLALPPRAADAHHSFAMFDNSKKVTVTGTVVDFQWANPHGYLYVLGSVGDEPPKKWGFEGTSISMLARKGWKSTDFKPGDKVIVVMNPMRDGTPGGALAYATRVSDGKVFLSYGAPPGARRAEDPAAGDNAPPGDSPPQDGK